MNSDLSGPRSLALRNLPRAALGAVLATLLFGLNHQAQSHPGHWTPSTDWTDGDSRKYAVHLVLLRGDGATYHSRILWWRGERSDSMWGGQRGWNPGGSGCDSFPNASFVSLGLPPSGVDIFCAGHIQMPDGRLMVIGGTDTVTGDYGEDRVRIFTPGTGSAAGSWSTPDSMKSWRWYPGSVGLADGRLVAMSGDEHRRHSIFGGRTSGGVQSSPQGDSLLRFAPVNGGAWEPALIPDGDPVAGRPLPREGHSAVVAPNSPFQGQVYFGGRDTNGTPLNDSWILRRQLNVRGSDYRYYWVKSGSPPSALTPRSEHCAVVASDTMMVIYGGLDQSNAAIGGQPWRLYYDYFTAWTWKDMVTTGTGPGARFGHAAVFDTSTLTVGGTPHLARRMILFGGASTFGGTPTDTTIYELRFDPGSANNARWIPMPQVNLHPGIPGPAPRYGHTLTWDATLRQRTKTSPWGHAAMMYGGALGGGAYSDTLWALWTLPDSTVGWQRIVPDQSLSTGPGPRARHSAAVDPGQGGGRLYIFGGETSSLADAYVYVVDPWNPGPQWLRWHDALVARSRHSGLLDDEEIKARVPEVYDPATGHWTAQTSAPLYQFTYPPTFLVGSGAGASRIVTLGGDQGDTTYWTDFPTSGQAGAWQQLGTSTLGFTPQAGVQYLPGQIMVAGGYTGAGVTWLTKTLDASSTSHNWVASDTLQRRFEHNLVVMPDGKVIAIGGVSSTGDFEKAGHAVHRPQIWDPAQGTWTSANGLDTLAGQPSARTYHSTAILLPDGRILSAGGEATGDQGRADLYCPPYLFKSGDTLATRPAIGQVVQRVRYGGQFSVCLSSADSIKTVSLIRAGATTHAFDQNQRYVPLTFAPDTLTSRLTVTAPPDSFVAPPGDYLLFLVNKLGVPSVAKWLRVGSEWNTGDVTKPDSVADLGADAISQHSIWWTWTVPGDDGAVGQPWQHKLVHKNVPITSANFASSSPEPNVVPECVGSLQTYEKDGLAACTYYYAAIQVVDESNNYSAIGYAPRARTLCSGGGGGGGSAHQAREEGQGPAGVGRMATHSSAAIRRTAASLAPSSVSQVLVASYEPTRGGAAWTLYRLDPAALGAGSDPSHIIFQEPDGAGGWRTRRDVAELPADLGLRSFRKSGRVVLPASYALQAVESHPPGFDLSKALDSTLGELAPDTLALMLGPTVAAGDTLRLWFTSTADTSQRGEDCFFIASRPLTAADFAGHRPRDEQPPAQPLVFALHQNLPNPFAATTTIGFSLPVASPVRLEVYDLLGRRVRTLANAFYPAGEHEVVWNRRTASGALAAPGLYFYRIAAGQYREKKRMVILP